MKRMFQICAGIDVHKAKLWVCLATAQDAEIVYTISTFGTTTQELLRLLDWLTQRQCESVAMESTGVYWKPVFNILEGQVPVVLANAQHVKGLPGRKTDVKDCEWLADLHLHGLIRPSFIPPVEIRDLRDLVRTRTQLQADRAQQSNRVQKVLEDANIKLASVATDVLGVSGRAMLDALVAGETDPQQLAELSRGVMRKKRTELQQALWGHIRPHQRVLLKMYLGLIDQLDASIESLTAAIEERMRPFSEIRQRLLAIPGVGERIATTFIAELGVDMERFPTAGHAASWAGLCPGHHESAGKRRGGRPRDGNRWLRQAFTQAGWAATRATHTYLQAQFRRLRARRGPKRAVFAVGHSIFVRCYHLIASGSSYQEPGGDYFDRTDRARTAGRLRRRLKQLGYDVQLTDIQTAA
jgi:transposase